MIIKNIRIEWAHIASPDQNGKYSVTLLPNKEQQAEIENYLTQIWVDEYGTKKPPAWLGSKKELEDGRIRFIANRKAKILKDGVEVERKLKVVDRHNKEYEPIPRVSNGAIVNLSLRGYLTEYQSKKGVSLGLNAIQLVEFEEYNPEDEFEALDEISDFVSDDFEIQPKISVQQKTEFLTKAGKNGWTAAQQAAMFDGLKIKGIEDVDPEIYPELLSIVSGPPPAKRTS